MARASGRSVEGANAVERAEITKTSHGKPGLVTNARYKRKIHQTAPRRGGLMRNARWVSAAVGAMTASAR
jgi:hypothetical protein